MSDTQARPQWDEQEALGDATERFHAALLEAHRTRDNIGHVEAAAAQYCRVLRRQGHSPERMLIDAKRVIKNAIDGDDAPVAERAVLSCIQHYFRD